MILYNAPASPFGRKTRVVAEELGIPLEERPIEVATSEFLDEYNPLRQIPTLVHEDGSAVYDSRVICPYLDSISGKPTLYPEQDRWQMLTREALGNGLMEAVLQRRMETLRPDGEKSPGFIAKLEARIRRSVGRLEAVAAELVAGPLRIDQITAACALEYADFRYSGEWRKSAPRVARWLEAFATRPSMVATRPK
jgi:glutathione S-transferase